MKSIVQTLQVSKTCKVLFKISNHLSFTYNFDTFRRKIGHHPKAGRLNFRYGLRSYITYLSPAISIHPDKNRDTIQRQAGSISGTVFSLNNNSQTLILILLKHIKPLLLHHFPIKGLHFFTGI